MKTTITIITGIFLISLASAVTIVGGECNSLEFPNEDNVTLKVTGNSSNMDGFNWSKSNTLIEYCFDISFAPDTFTLKWFNYQTVEEEVVGSTPSSGRSSGSYSSSYNPTQEKLEKGYTQVVREKDIINFKLINNHRITIKEMRENSIKLLIESEPITMTLNEGENKIVCISEDESLYLELKEIVNKKAKLLLKKSNEVCEEAVVDGITDDEVIDDEVIDDEVDEVDEQIEDDIGWKILLWGGLIAVVIIGYIILRRKEIPQLEINVNTK